MRKQEVIASMKTINILSIVILIIGVLFSAIIQKIIYNDRYFSVNWLLILFLFATIFVHESLHSIGYKYLAKVPRENIMFGIHKKYLTPYCVCKGFELDKKGYIYTMLLPNIALNILTLIILLNSSNILWSIYFGAVVSSGAGDYYMCYLASKYDSDVKFIDHPSAPGFFIIK